jgi:hypothetical protein
VSFEEQARREAAQAEEALQAKVRAAQLRKDVRDVFANAQARRLLSAFLQVAGADVSTLRHDQLTTGHAIGWQDAAGWWLNALRSHCPEKEVQMRAEAKREATHSASQGDTDDGSE